MATPQSRPPPARSSEQAAGAEQARMVGILVLIFIACAGVPGYRRGREWLVSH